MWSSQMWIARGSRRRIAVLEEPRETLFVGGKKPGAMLGAKHLEACRAFFPAARLEMLDTGHFVHAEAPGPFVELVDGWCRGVET